MKWLNIKNQIVKVSIDFLHDFTWLVEKHSAGLTFTDRIKEQQQRTVLIKRKGLHQGRRYEHPFCSAMSARLLSCGCCMNCSAGTCDQICETLSCWICCNHCRVSKPVKSRKEHNITKLRLEWAPTRHYTRVTRKAIERDVCTPKNGWPDYTPRNNIDIVLQITVF